MLSTLLFAAAFFSLLFLLLKTLLNIQYRDIVRVLEPFKDNCYLFVESPQEHRRIFQEKAPPLSRHAGRRTHTHHAKIRVLFYSHIRYLSALRVHCIEHDFDLNPSGELEIARVYDRWGLETCALIRPGVAGPMYPLLTNVKRHVLLSAVNLAILADQDGRVRVTEPTISRHVRIQREMRALCLSLPHSAKMLASLISDIVDDFADRCLDAVEEVERLSEKLQLLPVQSPITCV
ncbi:hypothetical protein BDZ89DRAFT_1109604 [Hymenopellis radicata]|nr:hypothetical protein BDZ89DRAFT_1109604 [Hymenopellis radicata]